MTAKSITYDQLREAIRIGFEGDSAIFELYDPNVLVATVNQIEYDIIRKVLSIGDIVIRGVYEKGSLIGYFIRHNGLLVSFALSPAYRIRKYLRKFFSLIKDEFGGIFMCYLWNKNVRGIRWLQKNGMVIAGQTNSITQLILK